LAGIFADPERSPGRSEFGPQGYDPVLPFKCPLIGQWHGSSDPKLEWSPKVRPDFMPFRGLDLHTPVPDETTRCRFRNALVKGGVYDDLPAEVCRQIEDHGLEVKRAEGGDHRCHADRERSPAAQAYRGPGESGRGRCAGRSGAGGWTCAGADRGRASM